MRLSEYLEPELVVIGLDTAGLREQGNSIDGVIVHEGASEGNPSLHITVNIHVRTWFDFLSDALNALVTRVEDRLAEGESIEEVARAERLNLVTTPPVTEAGQVPGQQFSIPPELRPLLQGAFEVDPDDPAFENPTKFVGPVYDKATADALAADNGWTTANPCRGVPRFPTKSRERFLSADELAVYVEAFERSGWHGAINRYRAQDLDAVLRGEYPGTVVKQMAGLMGRCAGVHGKNSVCRKNSSAWRSRSAASRR